MTGAAAKTPTKPPGRVDWTGEGWSVTLVMIRDEIAEAKVSTDMAAHDVAFLGVLNGCLKGMTLRQARDHGVQHACLKAAADQKALPVNGILMPVNFSPTSRAAAKALRAAIDAVMPVDLVHWNFEDNGLSEAWRKLPLETRRAKLNALIGEFLKQTGQPDAVIVTDIDVHDRVFMQFRSDFPLDSKPVLLMSLERHLRSRTGERIELFMSEMKDNNRIRRL
jgi:hypothetical protein